MHKDVVCRKGDNSLNIKYRRKHSTAIKTVLSSATAVSDRPFLVLVMALPASFALAVSLVLKLPHGQSVTSHQPKLFLAVPGCLRDTYVALLIC